jgi:spore coat protein CotH
MTTYKINRENRCCLLLCSVCSACIAAPSGIGETFGTSDGSGVGSISSSGSPDSGANSESGADSDASSDADSGATTEMSPSDLGPPPSSDPNQQIPPLDEEGCHGLYAQDLLPTFELTMSQEVWDELVQEWEDGSENEEMGIDHNPYHPLDEFRYGEIRIADAQIRLRGNPEFWDPEDKMQFQIGFNQNHKSGRFLGLRRLAFDAATFNRHMLRDRLALSIVRDMGIIATCANNARLVINGEYYGIFTNLEKLDDEFLQRVFDDPTGDLWDRHSWELKTNEDSTNDDRLNALLEADSIEELEEYLDFEQALRVFAAEAIIPDSDGMWAGGTNFFLYDDPISGKFVMLPWDFDNTFERFSDPPDGDYPVNPDPVVWEKPTTHGRPWYEEALDEDEWFEYYIEAIGEQFESSYSVEKLHSRIDTWTAQIQDSVLEDTNKPYSNEKYLDEVQQLRDYVQTRHDFMVEWLECWEEGGEPDDEGYCEEP